MATIYNYYTLISPKPSQYGVFPEFKFGYNTGRVINRIYLPVRFGAAKYYFDGTHGNLEGIAQIDEHGQPYCDVNFNDGEIGVGTVTFTANGETATLPYRLIATPVYETIVDVNDIDISGLVTEQTFNTTVAQLNQTISDGDTANRTAIDQLTAQTNQKFSDVNAQLQSAVESVGALDAQVKNLASEVDGYAADIAKAVADAADAKSVAESAADDAATADAAAKEAQDGVDALTTRVGAVENSVETAETTANEAKSAAQTAQTTAGEAQTAAASAKSRADEAYTLADTADGKADTASTAASAAQSTADGVKTRVDTIEQTTIPGINAHVEALQAGEETLNKSIELVEGEVDTLTETQNQLGDSIDLLTQQVEKLGDPVTIEHGGTNASDVLSARGNLNVPGQFGVQPDMGTPIDYGLLSARGSLGNTIGSAPSTDNYYYGADMQAVLWAGAQVNGAAAPTWKRAMMMDSEQRFQTLWSGSLYNGNGATITDGGRYAALLIGAVINGTNFGVYAVPAESITVHFSEGGYYMDVELKTNTPDLNLYVRGANNSAGRITYVWGILKYLA